MRSEVPTDSLGHFDRTVIIAQIPRNRERQNNITLRVTKASWFKLCSHSLVDLRTDESRTKMSGFPMLLILVETQRESHSGRRTREAVPYEACCASGSSPILKPRYPACELLSWCVSFCTLHNWWTLVAMRPDGFWNFARVDLLPSSPQDSPLGDMDFMYHGLAMRDGCNSPLFELSSERYKLWADPDRPKPREPSTGL